MYHEVCTRILCVGVLILASVTSPIVEAVYYNGRYINTIISRPFMPGSEEDCQKYSREVQEALDEISHAHEGCLEEPGESGKVCSKASCENLHVARDDLGLERSEAMKACRHALALSSSLKRIYNTATTSSSSGSNSNSTPSKIIKNSVKNANEIKKKCDAMYSQVDKQACYDSIHDYTDDARSSVNGSSIVGAIQDSSSDSIREHNKDMLDEIESVGKQIEEFGKVAEDKWSDKWD